MSLDSNTTELNEILDMAINLPPESKVNSVNGKTGDVVLNATDVHALPDTTIIPTIPENVSAFKNDVGYLTEHQSLEEYEKKTGTNEKIFEHNVSENSHQDIRLLLQGLSERINAVLDSDDTTLDQLSEIVSYIKSNKDLIDAVTTEKISYSDIINNLETNVSNKPLSAAMGVALKALIDAIVVPTKVSDLQNDSNFINKTTFDEALSEVEKPFVITATADLANMRLTNVSRSFDEIMSAYNRKDHIFLEVEASQLGFGSIQINLNLLTESVLMFETIVNLDSGEKSARLSAYIHPDGGGNFEIAELVQSTQIGGLTFVISDTVPTVNDRNIITFVIEE